MIKDQTEINGVTTIDYKEHTWSATSFLCDRIHQISNAKTYVFADSVLFLRGFKENPNEAWKEKIKLYFENNQLKDLNRIDGESMEFEWKMFQGFTTSDLLTQIQEFMKAKIVIQSSSKAGPSSCQCSTTLYGEKKEMNKNIKVMVMKLRIIFAGFLAVIGHSWDLDQKRSGPELTLTNLMVIGTQLLKT